MNFVLLQGIFLTQESNPGLPHCGQILYRLSYEGTQYFLDICCGVIVYHVGGVRIGKVIKMT